METSLSDPLAAVALLRRALGGDPAAEFDLAALDRPLNDLLALFRALRDEDERAQVRPTRAPAPAPAPSVLREAARRVAIQIICYRDVGDLTEHLLGFAAVVREPSLEPRR